MTGRLWWVLVLVLGLVGCPEGWPSPSTDDDDDRVGDDDDSVGDDDDSTGDDDDDSAGDDDDSAGDDDDDTAGDDDDDSAGDDDDDSAGDDDDDTTGDDDDDSAPVWPETIGGSERPALVQVPDDWDGIEPLPAMILLHGYGATAELQALYMSIPYRVNEDRFILVLPEGTRDVTGVQFWNATPGCCDLYGSGVDDVAYLSGLIEELQSTFPTDPDRLYLMGHSNGGFMSYRMACEAGEQIAAIAIFAGADFIGDEDCVPGRAPSVLHVHGTADVVIPYGGLLSRYPSVETVLDRWSERAECSLAPVSSGSLDLAIDLGGDETDVERWVGCSEGRSVEHWRMNGSSHSPVFRTAFAEEAMGWLLGHSL